MYSSALLAASALAATVSAASCVSSTAATTHTNNSSDFTLPNYTAVAAPISGTAYDINATFAATYAFESTMVTKSPLSSFLVCMRVPASVRDDGGGDD